CPRQDNGEHGDRIDHFHDAAEPCPLQCGIEPRTQCEFDGRRFCPPMAVDELVHLLRHDALYVAATGECLRHAGGVHVQLDLGVAATAQDVALEAGRDGESKGEFPRVHAGINLGL